MSDVEAAAQEWYSARREFIAACLRFGADKSEKEIDRDVVSRSALAECALRDAVEAALCRT